MAMGMTYGELRKLLAEEELGWATEAEEADETPLPQPALGATKEGLIETEQGKPFEFESLGTSPNPQLTVRRIGRGFVSEQEAMRTFPRTTLLREGMEEVVGGAAEEAPPEGGMPPSSLDWRARWGGNWITTVRDQNPCNACWAFAGVALVESMLKIEHAYWARLSEGDPHRGVGKVCPDEGNLDEVSRFFAANGFCDPGSWPWRTDTVPYAPTPDRNGRSVRGPAFEMVSVADSKNWLDTVGPLVTWLGIYDDFAGLRGSSVYRHSTSPANRYRGGHFMLIIGYDDSLGAWLCKNSWGTWWGNGGFGWIAYGDSEIDQYLRYGVRNLNPDPWTKRRLHNGNLYESGNGALHRNLEVVGSNGSRVQHRWREGGLPFTWGAASSFAGDAAVCPTLIGTTYDRNMEIVYMTTGGRLHHWWTDGGGSGPWHDGGVFGPTGCHGVPGFVQSDYGAPGNFEVVVAVGGGHLQHLWRDGAGWHNGPLFGGGIAYSGATLVQGTYGSPHPNLECVATCIDGTMQHYWRDESTLTWHTGASFGSSVGSPPVMIQGQYGMGDESGPHGNFELCVAVGGRVQHWWRANSGDMVWRHSADFGREVAAVAGLCESSWGMNLEVIVLRRDGQLRHYWRDGAGWHDGPVIGPA
jgi:Papain family cysteine protease